MNRILACIDASTYATSVVDLAAWAATRLTQEVELLHVVQRKDAVAARNDHSGAIGLGVKTELLEELTRIEAAGSRLAVEEGRILLDAGIDRLRAAGVEARPLHRHGGIVETIVEREADASLVVIGKRGASGAFATDHLGSKVERVARASNRPVLVASREVSAPQTIVIAYDGSAAAQKAVTYVAESALFTDLPVHIVMAGADNATRRSRLNQALASLTARREPPSCFLVDDSAEKVIGNHMLQHRGAMLVMGAYGHSPLRALIVGSTTTTMIRTVHVPVLLVR